MQNEKAKEVDTEEFIPIHAAAKKLGVSSETLRRWDKQGKIKARRVGTGKWARRMFKKSELEALVNIQL